MRLLLIAHGETDAMRRAAFALDEGLSDRGLAAVRALAGMQADRVWSSPAAAALETAQALDLVPKIDDALRDLDVGRWRGRGLAEVAAAEPAGIAAWREDPAFSGHGGEPVAALVARIGDWLAAGLAQRGDRVALTHAAVVRAAVVAVLGAPPAAFWSIDVAPLAHIALHGDGRRWALRAQPLP